MSERGRLRGVVAAAAQSWFLLVQLADGLLALFVQHAALGLHFLTERIPVLGHVRTFGLEPGLLFGQKFLGFIEVLTPRLQFLERRLQLLGLLAKPGLRHDAFGRRTGLRLAPVQLLLPRIELFAAIVERRLGFFDHLPLRFEAFGLLVRSRLERGHPRHQGRIARLQIGR